MSFNNLSTDYLESKIASKRALIEYFSTKHELWYPDCNQFNTGFAISVFNGEKKLLSLKDKGAPIIGEIKDFPFLGKENLLKMCTEDQELNKYIPHNSNHKRISKEFLNSLIYSKKRELHNTLMNIFTNKKIEKVKNFKQSISIPVNSHFVQGLNDFSTNYKSSRSKQFFQFKKYSNCTNFIKNIDLRNQQFQNNNQLQNNFNSSVNLNQGNNYMNNVDNNTNHISLNDNNNQDNLHDKFLKIIKDLTENFFVENKVYICQEIPNEDVRANIFEKILQKFVDNYDYYSINSLNIQDQIDLVKKYFLTIV